MLSLSKHANVCGKLTAKIWLGRMLSSRENLGKRLRGESPMSLRATNLVSRALCTAPQTVFSPCTMNTPFSIMMPSTT